jgi:hypothetical protein
LAELQQGLHPDWLRWSLSFWASQSPAPVGLASLVPDHILDPQSNLSWFNAGARLSEVYLTQLRQSGLDIPSWPSGRPGLVVATLSRVWIEGDSFPSPYSLFVEPGLTDPAEYFAVTREVRVVHRWYRLSTCGIARQLKLFHNSCFSLVGVRPSCPGTLAARGWCRVDGPSLTSGLFVRDLQPDLIPAAVLTSYCPLSLGNIDAFHERDPDSFTPWRFEGWRWYSEVYSEDRTLAFSRATAEGNLWSTRF